METILRGVRQFHSHVFPEKRDLFQRLAASQKPHALFIACSDSRVHPNLITQTEPGELFILRNPGNIVPPYQASGGSEAATIEYALDVLKINNIIICGHSNCGAIAALMQPEKVRSLPAVSNWLQHAECTRRIVSANESLSPNERLDRSIKQNVLCQVSNLRTHPSVAAHIASGNLSIYAWVYDIGSGDVEVFDPQEQWYLSIMGHACDDLKRINLCHAETMLAEPQGVL